MSYTFTGLIRFDIDHIVAVEFKTNAEDAEQELRWAMERLVESDPERFLTEDGRPDFFELCTELDQELERFTFDLDPTIVDGAALLAALSRKDEPHGC